MRTSFLIILLQLHKHQYSDNLHVGAEYSQRKKNSESVLKS